MKNLHYPILLFVSVITLQATTLNAQNIGINATGATPNSSAMLDIDGGSLPVKKGLLIPRVTAAERTAMNPLPAAAQGLTVYQTDAPQGYYYNTSITTTPSWSYLSQGWSLTGNAGTSPATNFIGTTDAADFVIRANNTEQCRATSSGNFGIGTAAPSLAKFQVQGSVGNTVAMFGSSANSQGISLVADYPGIYFNNYWNSGSYKAMASTGFYAAIKCEQNNGLGAPGALTFYTSNNSNMAQNSAVSLSERMRIDQNGYVGIGTANPVRPLEIATGPLRFSNPLGDIEFTECVDLLSNVTTALPGPTTPVFRVHSNATLNNILLFMQHNGNTGLGTTTPNNAHLQVEGMTGNTVAYFCGNTTPQNRRGVSLVADEPGIYFNCYWNGGCKAMAGSGFPAVINVDQNTGAMRFYTTNTQNSTPDVVNNGIERLRISGTGEVAIGTLTPSAGYKLTVAGSAIASGGTWVNSDARYKKNILPLENALESVVKLQGVTYYYKTDEFPQWNFDSNKQIGFIAQEVEKVFPELVKTNNEGYKAVSYEKFTPVLIEAIKQQQQQIELLKSEIENLKNK